MRRNKDGKLNLWDLKRWENESSRFRVYRINLQWIIEKWDENAKAYRIRYSNANSEREALEQAYSMVCEGGEA